MFVPAVRSIPVVVKPRKINPRTAQRAYESQAIHESLGANVSDDTLRWWPEAASKSISVSLGSVLYPTKAVKDLKVVVGGPARPMLSSAFFRTLKSPRQFLTKNLGLKPPPPSKGLGRLEYREELRILMNPTAVATRSTEDSTPIPDLEIRMIIDKYKRTINLGSVRLIFETRQADLVLPGQPADLRFATELYASANTPTKMPPQIEDFLGSSNLNIWGTDRLKTPPNLDLPIPRYCVQSPSRGNLQGANAGSQAIGVSSPENINYAFASLEHISDLVERWGDLDVVYFFIEAGRTGGRREGLRISGSPSTLKSPASALIQVANTLIANSLQRSSDVSATEPVPVAKPRNRTP